MTARRLLLLALIATSLLSRTTIAAPATSMPRAFTADAKKDAARVAANAKEHIGDSPDDAGSIATDLSPAITRPAVLAAMRKVADREISNYQPYFANSWTWCTLYAGLIATSQASGDAKYETPLLAVAEKYQWKLGRRLEHADDHCIGQVYLDLYFEHSDPKMVGPTRAQFDQLIAKGGENKWTWCDALFMGPPIWARLAKASGERKYIDYMNTNWWRTTDLLYDRDEHLFFRDAKFILRRDEKGRKVFWSRGNGWVMGGLVQVLTYIPANDPRRPFYVEKFRQMAEKLRALQGEDGLWRPGLLDAAAYPYPEISGSSFFVYAMAWGVHHGLLDKGQYRPAVERGWSGLVKHIYADGRLGSIQPIGAAPGAYTPGSSYVFGVGAFLLAGSEVNQISR